MTHFYHGFYFRLFQSYKNALSFEEIMAKSQEKLEREYTQKLLFPEAKAKVEPLYQAWKTVFTS